MGNFVDLSGKTYNEWRVIGRDPIQEGDLIYWISQCGCGTTKSVVGTNLVNGKSKSCGKCNQIIYGFGINDLGRVVTNDPIYLTWKRMVERCYAEVVLGVNPTYKDKRVSEEWRYASKFEKWMTNQNWEGMELDKDMILIGNKEYHPDLCWFIPKRVNLVLGVSEGKRGEYPLGVCHHNDGVNKYVARSGQKYLGIFPTIDKAHAAWQKQKSEDLVKVVDWWQHDHQVNHTFHQKIAENIFSISSKILKELSDGVHTKILA